MRSSLIWVCTVCSDLSVPIFKIITVLYPGHSYQSSDVIRAPRLKRAKIFANSIDPDERLMLLIPMHRSLSICQHPRWHLWSGYPELTIAFSLIFFTLGLTKDRTAIIIIWYIYTSIWLHQLPHTIECPWPIWYGWLTLVFGTINLEKKNYLWDERVDNWSELAIPISVPPAKHPCRLLCPWPFFTVQWFCLISPMLFNGLTSYLA